MKKLIIVGALLAAGYYLFIYQPPINIPELNTINNDQAIIKHLGNKSNSEIASYLMRNKTTPQGFVQLPDIVIRPKGILVVAPPACPKNQQIQIKQLMDQLRAKNIPASRTNHISLELDVKSKPTTKQLDITNVYMNSLLKQPAPLVIINGKVKSNPSMEEIIKEYNSR